MHLDRGAVQRARLHLQANDLLLLQSRKGTRQYTGLAPAPHPRVDGVPVAKFLGQTPPLGSILGDVEDGVEHFEIAVSKAATVLGKAMGDLLVMILSQLYAPWSPKLATNQDLH